MSTIIVTTPKCIVCNKESTLFLERAEWAALQGGALIQNALPTRDASFRELVKTGTHPECWERMFGDVAEQEDDEDPEPPSSVAGLASIRPGL